MSSNFHEQLVREAPPLPSARATGWVFAAVSLIVALVWRQQVEVLAVALGLALAFGGLATLAPKLLEPLNRAWFALGLVLHRVVSPVIMFVLFAGLIVPFGVVMQSRYDPLRKRRDPAAKSYWVDRTESAPSPSGMTSPF